MICVGSPLPKSFDVLGWQGAGFRAYPFYAPQPNHCMSTGTFIGSRVARHHVDSLSEGSPSMKTTFGRSEESKIRFAPRKLVANRLLCTLAPSPRRVRMSAEYPVVRPRLAKWFDAGGSALRPFCGSADILIVHDYSRCCWTTRKISQRSSAVHEGRITSANPTSFSVPDRLIDHELQRLVPIGLDHSRRIGHLFRRTRHHTGYKACETRGMTGQRVLIEGNWLFHRHTVPRVSSTLPVDDRLRRSADVESVA